MTPRARWAIVVVITTIALGAASVYGAFAFARYQQRQQTPPDVAIIAAPSSPAGPVDNGPAQVYFRNTASGADFGHVASVPLSSPQGARTITDQVCDRLYATRTDRVCLRTNPGILTTFEAVEFNAAWTQLRTWPLPGIPSRVRIGADDTVATTAFVTGHAYAPTTFSTATVIERGGQSVNLEDYTFTINGKTITAADRNFWGVTFASDGDTFYATAATGRSTWLVRGSMSRRTLTAIHDTVECPSLSPDGTHIAYKKNVADGLVPDWRIAVLDVATNTETVLAEKHSVDDQVEWLDDSTVLYGLPRAGQTGDSDVWSIGITASAAPSLFIRHAWSPAVVR
ncbi:hypothetical protein [Glaciihabitans sp. dw_435]|uniref:hypothetical protein n=1 Tax=Glaciihabitans sp. dw_435 TaxID=2720081 RepID=UPI001BD4934F|nr:hypothetical protein [Glaciihabitans sp. dw_435]